MRDRKAVPGWVSYLRMGEFNTINNNDSQIQLHYFPVVDGCVLPELHIIYLLDKIKIPWYKIYSRTSYSIFVPANTKY